MTPKEQAELALLARPVIHSKEYMRRRMAGECTTEDVGKTFLIDDCVPEEGEHSQGHPEYQKRSRIRTMTEAAHSLAVTCQKRGIKIVGLELSIGEQHCAWQGKDL